MLNWFDCSLFFTVCTCPLACIDRGRLDADIKLLSWQLRMFKPVSWVFGSAPGPAARVIGAASAAAANSGVVSEASSAGMAGGATVSNLLSGSFAEVIDAQSARYEVPAGVLQCVMKPMKNFYKVIALLLDVDRSRMWSEAIGNYAEMDALRKKLQPGHLLLFRSLQFKRSQYHSGGKFLDLSKRLKVRIDALPPTHDVYAKLCRAMKKGPLTIGDIAGLEGMAKGNKADLLCKICSVTHRILKEDQARMYMAFVFCCNDYMLLYIRQKKK